MRLQAVDQDGYAATWHYGCVLGADTKKPQGFGSLSEWREGVLPRGGWRNCSGLLSGWLIFVVENTDLSDTV